MKFQNSNLNKTNYSYMDFESDAGVLSINLARQSCRFVHNDISSGQGTFEMKISHFYNDYAHLSDTGMGNNWQLNIQQYIKKYDGSIYLEGFTTNDYIYVDGAGQIHQFSPIENSNGRYVDQSGSGLVLVVNYREYQINDNQNGSMNFDSSGRLISIVTQGTKNSIIKFIEYNSDGLPVKYYDSRCIGNRERYFKLEYKNRLLYKISLISKSVEKESIYYNYDGYNLKGIYHFINNNLSHISMFRYDNSLNKKLIFATGTVSGRALDFQKVGNSYSIKSGISKIQVNSLAFLGSDVNSGEGVIAEAHYPKIGISCINKLYVGDNVVFLGDNLSLFDIVKDDNMLMDSYNTFSMNAEFDSTIINYYSTFSDVKGYSHVIYRYYFNKEGTVISNFEVNGNDLLTLRNDSGYCVTENKEKTYNAETINRKEIYTRENGQTVGFYNLDHTAYRSYRGYCESKKARFVNNVCSFWLRHYSSNATYMEATISVHTNMSNYKEKIRVDHLAYNAWQYVEIPFSINEEQLGRGYVIASISLGLDTDGSVKYDISNVRLNGASKSFLKYDAPYISDFYKMTNFYSVRLVLSTGNEKIIRLSGSTYITESDIIESMKNVSLCKKNGSVDFIYCGGKKRVGNVKNIYFKVAENPQNIGLKNEYEGLGLLILKNVTKNEDNSNIINKGYDYYNGQFIIDIASNSERKYVKSDLQGRVLESVDSYGKKTVKKYDDYGNLLSTIVAKESAFDSQNNLIAGNKRLYLQLEYDDNTESGKYREMAICVKNEEMKVVYSKKNDKINMIEDVETDGKRLNFTYDDINRLTTINSSDKSNHISYDDNGRLSSVSDNLNYKYDYNSDIYGNTNKIKLNSQDNGEFILHESEIEYKPKQILTQKNNISGCESTMYYDEYGRIKRCTRNTNGTVHNLDFTYQKKNDKINDEFFSNYCDESPSLSQVKIIKDDALNMETVFEFDTDNNAKGFTLCKDGKHYLSMENEDAHTTKCKIGDTDYKIIREYNANSLEPRILKLNNCDGNGESLGKYCYSYEYNDIVGEVSKRLGGNSSVEFSFENTDNAFYYSSIPQSKKQVYGNNRFDFVYHYDSNMDIVGYDQTGYALNQLKYTYDSLNRISKENNSGLGATFEYKFNQYNRLASVVKNGYDYRTFCYDAIGRIKSYTTNGNLCAEYTYSANSLYPYSIRKNGNFYRLIFNNLGLLSYYGNYNYIYDSMGVRVRKNAGEQSADFYYSEGKLLGEDKTYTRAKIRYLYDQQEIVGARYHSSDGTVTEYEYVKDACGNVVAVVNGNNVVVQYRYDAWGNCTEINKNTNDPFAKINPIRYRSYYMDLETGYYYLQTRYYDPEIGAFISPDSVDYLDPESIGGLNLYAYCLNNPIKYFDPTGHSALLFFLSLVFSVGLSVGIVAYEDYKDDGAVNGSNKDWRDYAGAFFNGVVSAIGQRFLFSLLTAFIGDIGESIINGEIEEDGFWATAGMSVLSSTISFGIGKVAKKAARKVGTIFKARKFIKLKGVIDNSTINKELREIANNLNIGCKKATLKRISHEIYTSNVWEFGKKIEKIVDIFF